MITILIPAYNEEQVIKKAVESILSQIRLDENYEILVVNDGSTDKTLSILRSLEKKHDVLHIISHKTNKGLGGALQTGFKNAKGRIIVTMDADLTHPITMIPRLVKACNDVDVCYASRYVGSGGMKNVPFWRVVLSRSANLFFQLILWTPIKDTTAGFRAYKKEILTTLHAPYRGFEIQLALTAQIAKKRLRVREIAYTLVNREIGTSKFSIARSLPKYALKVIRITKDRWFSR